MTTRNLYQKLRIISGILILLPFFASAQNVPSKISYQGILYENGYPVDTIKDFTFSIGSSWTETHQSVQVVNGRYIVQLGTYTPLTVSIFEGQTVVELIVEVGSNPLSPGVDLLTVPYAFFAQKAENANQLNGFPASFYGIPVGTILPFGGITVPDGWLLCDGSEVSRSDSTANLFNALGLSWGAGDFAATFNLPDLRGRFLRGVDGDADRVTDDSTRTADFVGGNTGDMVGSYQKDEFASHNHETVDHIRTGNLNSVTGNGGPQQIYADDGNSISPANPYDMAVPRGGAETRPINANVYYIIKY